MKKVFLFFTILFLIFIFTACSNDNSVNQTDSLNIISLNPNLAKINDNISIIGTHFGISRDSSIVNFNGKKADVYLSWSDTLIKVKVPVGAQTGKVFVTVKGKKSNEVDFTLKSMMETELIPAGTFLMGNTGAFNSFFEFQSELPIHTVTLTKSFYMGKYEVTQEEWITVFPQEPHNFSFDTWPAYDVTWNEAINFCNKLSEIDGLTKCYTINGQNVSCNWDANGWRLPTEAEWEYACKAGTTTDFYSGSMTNEDGLDPNLNKIGWFDNNSNFKFQAVGDKDPNKFGLYDMSGNVLEWCWDIFENYSDIAVTDPKGPISGTNNVVRGGNWELDAHYCRSSSRFTSGNIYWQTGFRICRAKVN
jgi:formylglycine-generating enzyme required for sulfatase activity